MQSFLYFCLFFCHTAVTLHQQQRKTVAVVLCLLTYKKQPAKVRVLYNLYLFIFNSLSYEKNSKN